MKSTPGLVCLVIASTLISAYQPSLKISVMTGFETGHVKDSKQL
jgi:hypothetical protein